MLRTLVLVALLIPGMAVAEMKVGTVEVGGDLGLSYSSATAKMTGFQNLDSSTFKVQADALYYVTPRFGVGVGFSSEKTTQKSGGIESKDSSLLIGPGAVVDIPVAERVSLFLQGVVGYVTMDSDGESFSGWGLSGGGGLKWFPVPTFSVNGGLSLARIEVEHTSGTKLETSGISLDVGVSVYFGR